MDNIEKPINAMTSFKPKLAEEHLAKLSMVELSRMIRKKKVSCNELIQEYFERIRKFDGQEGINSYITIDREKSIQEAKRLDELSMQNKYLGPLHGLPLAVKDNLDTKDIRTTGGSKILKNWIPDSDANVVSRLRAAGAIIIGKTNMSEFARGITNDNPHYGPVRNPYDKTRIPGGSSGGSAAAVAAGLCAGAIGSDSGGSIRIPSALCGVVGLKPTLGLVGRGGFIYLSFTTDVIGPITRTVEDSAMILKVIAGPDSRDPEASAAKIPNYNAFLKVSLKGIKLGIPRKFFYEDNDPEVDRLIDQALKTLEKLGATLVDVEIKHLEIVGDTSSKIIASESIYSFEEYLTKFDPAATIDKYLPQLGTDTWAKYANQKGTPESKPVPAYSYLEAVRTNRAKILRSLEEALKEVDALIAPTTPLPAVKFTEEVETELRERKVGTFLTFIRYMRPISVAGLPAISVPAGRTAAGLPIGIQVVGRLWDEPKIMEVAYAYQQATKWYSPPKL
jgi:aspartyl-tRNA(Asn)/glutamyl-tRNA(Gln) amidotransferase subunit A